MPSQNIKSAQAWRVKVPLLADLCASPEFGGQPIGPDRLILKLTDHSGHHGWGEGQFKPGDDLAKTLLRIVNVPLSSFRTQFLDLWAPNATYYHLPSSPSPYANPPANLRHRLRHPFQTPFEMALLDLSSRRAGVSLSQHWGGLWRDAIPTDYWMGRVTPKDARRLTRRAIRLGFRGIKIKTTLEDPNVQRLEAIKQAAGSKDFHVTVDPNQRFYRLDDARPTILDMDKVGNMRILEDPFPRQHLQDAAALRPHINARMVIHVEDPDSLHSVLTSGAAGGINIDSHTVGLQGWRNLAAAVDAANLPCWHGSALDLGIYTAAQLHLAAVTPNCQLPGDQIGPWLRESHLLKHDFTLKEGAIVVPTGPGLGVDVDQSLVERYAVESFQA
jgi:L-alanine-DL-glutamate epimerase-like enolase superfamily enzyme